MMSLRDEVEQEYADRMAERMHFITKRFDDAAPEWQVEDPLCLEPSR